MPLYGFAMQCRITTEDPENNFVPDYGKISAYRSPAGFGIRLDAGTAYTGAIITRSYDSLLVKVTAWSPTAEETIARMHRALWEFREALNEVVAATARQLTAEVKGGRFREDLYYRLAGLEIQIPALRERREDIPRLVAHFLKRSCARLSLPDRQPMARSSGRNDDSSGPTSSGGDAYVRSPTALTFPYSSLDDGSL